MSDKKDVRIIILQVSVNQDEFETLNEKRGTFSMSSYLRDKGLKG